MSVLSRMEARFDLEAYLEELDPKKYGDEWAVTCSECEKEGKLWVRMKKKETRDGVLPKGSFICYYCNAQDEELGKGRGALQLIQWLEDVDFPEACKRLGEGGTVAEESFVEAVAEAMRDFDVTRPDEDEDDEDEAPPEISLPTGFTRIRESNAPMYLAERGITIERAQRFQLGFCKRGFYANRLIVPAIQDGALVGFQARYMQKKPLAGIKKTLFPKGMKKSRILYNHDEARWCKRVVLVEDPFSALHIGRTGLALYGTKLSARQMELLLGMEAREVVWMLDPGKEERETALKQAAAMTHFFTVRVVELPGKRDPDEQPRKRLQRYIEGAKRLTSHDAFARLVQSRLAAL